MCKLDFIIFMIGMEQHAVHSFALIYKALIIVKKAQFAYNSQIGYYAIRQWSQEK